MKKLLSIFTMAVIFLSFPLTAYASETESVPVQELQMVSTGEYTEEWRPMARWANISIITMNVDPNGGNVTVSYDVQGYFPENTIRVTCTLQRFINGKWQNVKSQTKSSKFYCASSVSGTVAKNLLTRETLTITVLDKNGRVIENAYTYSQAYTVY